MTVKGDKTKRTDKWNTGNRQTDMSGNFTAKTSNKYLGKFLFSLLLELALLLSCGILVLLVL